jgi:hypothetical protein
VSADLFNSHFRFPLHVTILAPGPNGKPFWHLIDPESYVLAVNHGVSIPINKTAWCVADWWAIRSEWFQAGMRTFPGATFFSYGVSRKLDLAGASQGDFLFHFVPSFCHGGYTPHPRMFRPDGTVSGIAMEMCARLGTQRITLCGVDMSGNQYYDGGISESKTCPHGDVWTYVPFLNSLIGYYRKQGVQFESLSPTRLAVTVKPG